MDALKQKIQENPELSHLQTLFEDDNVDQDMLAMLLDQPQLLEYMIDINQTMARHGVHNQHDDDHHGDIEMDENDPRVKMKKASKINDEWFKSNTPIDIIKQTRHEFNHESKSRKSIGCLVHDIVKTKFEMELTKDICDEIELLSLMDEGINIIEINYDAFTQQILSIMSEDINYVENNLLNNNKMNIMDCIFTQYLEKKLFKNHSNVINCSKHELYKNTNTQLNGDRIKCGDIIHIISDSMHTSFSDIWYIVDTDNITMRRIGIKKYGQYKQDPHIIIPGFVSEYLLDPIASYATFIHHHCWENGTGTIEIELQITKQSIIFSDNVQHKSLIRHMSDDDAVKLIAEYGWKQKDWGSKYRKNKHFVKDMENEEFYTLYIKTDAGAYGPLIGHCNHPNVSKINLAAICHQNSECGYVIKYNLDRKNKEIFTEQQVDALLLSLCSDIQINKVSTCLKRGIAFGVVKIDKEKGLDTTLINDPCIYCSNPLSCTIRDALYQPDYAGFDYCDGAENGAAQCQKDGCFGSYVTGICNGRIKFDSGKFHNHCTECPNMGQCIYDYRNQHCYGCGDHYFAGSSGNFSCHTCHPKNDVFG